VIFDFISHLAISVVKALIDLLPNATYNDGGWGATAGAVLRYPVGLNGDLPIAETAACLGLALTYVGTSWAYRAVQWVWTHIPFVG
jgi:hypothetical protein